MDYIWNKAAVTVGQWAQGVAGSVALYKNPVLAERMRDLAAVMKRNGGDVDDARVVAAMDNLMRMAKFYHHQRGMSYAPSKKEAMAMLSYDGKLDTEEKIKIFMARLA